MHNLKRLVKKIEVIKDNLSKILCIILNIKYLFKIKK